MKVFNRAMSVFLTFAMLLSMAVVPAYAEKADASVDTGAVTVSGTNSFGSLLSEEIQEEQTLAEEEAAGDYNVLGLTVEGNTATVEYASMEAATVIVGIYTEDGRQLLCSGYAEAAPEQTQVEVTIEGEMEPYFVAKAYLVDQYDLSPLCTAYSTPMYTQEMQQLLASKASDYDPALVLNLDDSDETNFAVYHETVTVLEFVEGVNTVVSADDETFTYVLGNIDETVSGLQPGDILAYSYGENGILIVKVENLTVDGTTATITGTDVEMSEVFSHMKLENSGQTEDMVVDTDSCEEGIIYKGLVVDDEMVGVDGGAEAAAYGIMPAAYEDDVALKFAMQFGIDKQFGEHVTVKGGLELSVKATFSYYIAMDRQFVEFKLNIGAELSVSVEGKGDVTLLKLPSFGFSPIPGVYIGFEPEFKLEFTATFTFAIGVDFSSGFAFEKGEGFKSLDSSAQIQLSIKGEGVVFLGIDLGPHISILGGSIAKIKLSTTWGYELKFTTEIKDGLSSEVEKVLHTCDMCMNASVYRGTSIAVELKFLNCKYLSFNWSLSDSKKKLGVLYYSFDHSEFGWGECPYQLYRVTIGAKDLDEEYAEGVEIIVDDQGAKENLGATNSKGVVYTYLPEGTYTFSATINGTNVSYTKEVKRSCKVTLYESGKHLHGGIGHALGYIDISEITDYTKKAYGKCGDGLSWVLYQSGELVVEGQGSMYFDEESDSWDAHKSDIKTVYIEDGVTSISYYAFYGCTNLEKVVIADSVTSFGGNAFYGCTALKEIKLPVDVTTYNAFMGCTNVEAIHYTYGTTGVMTYRSTASSATGIYTAQNMEMMLEYQCRSSLKSVVFEDEITSISALAFYNPDLTAEKPLCNVYLPECLESIGSSAFAGNTKLTKVELPEELTGLGASAFANCTGLTEIQFPDTLTSIGGNAFYGCTGLEKVTIPDTITSIGSGAFANCTGLLHVTLPVDVTTYYVFTGSSNIRSIRYTYGTTGVMTYRSTASSATGIYTAQNMEMMLEYQCRESLEKVVFDDEITSISSLAFYNPDVTAQKPLWDVTLPDCLESIGASAFANNTKLTQIELPDDLTSLGSGVFSGCTGLKSIKFPEKLTAIPGNAFSGCTGLTTLTIPDTVTGIGSGSFSNCTGLLHVTLPVDVTTYYAFIGSSNIRSIHYTYGTTGVMTSRSTASSATGIYTAQNMEMMLEYQCRESLETVEFDDEITSISALAFYNPDISAPKPLHQVTLPTNLKSIGASAFAGNTKLTQITLPEGLTSLGSGVFSGCTGLESIKFPEKLTAIPGNAFSGCTGLTTLTIPDTITSIGSGSFLNCTGLLHVTLPVDVTTYYAFIGSSNIRSIHYTYGTTGVMTYRSTASSATGIYTSENMEKMLEYQCRDSLAAVTFEDTVSSISNLAYYGNTVLTEVTLPAALTSIGSNAFGCCTALSAVWFRGSVPSIYSNAFTDVSASAYYPEGDTTWTASVMTGYGGTLTWESYLPAAAMTLSLDEPGEETQPQIYVAEAVKETEPVEVPTVYAVFGGDYESESYETYTLKTASFTGLTAGKEYLLLVVADVEAEDLITGNNLLYISQGAADENGDLSFQYVQRAETDISYVMACGASDKDLSDAVITFPKMVADEEVQAVEPVVVYDGVTLEEEVDYVVVGTVDYTEAGTYTCYVRGINNYTGLVTCPYTVAEATPALFDIAAVSMTLGNDLTMYFWVPQADVADTAGYVQITKTYADGREDVVKQVAISDCLSGDGYYLVPFNGISAKEMTDTLYAEVYDSNDVAVSNPYETSVESYALDMLRDADSTDALKTVIADMLNYGAAAQTEFGYNTAAPANANMTEAEAAYATAEFDVTTLEAKAVHGEAGMSVTMTLKSSIVLNVFLDPSIVTTDMTAKISYTNHNSKAVSYEIPGSEFVALGGYYLYLNVDTLAASDIETVVTVEIYDGATLVSTSQYNMASYCVNNASKPIVVALAKFCASANAYFHS